MYGWACWVVLRKRWSTAPVVGVVSTVAKAAVCGTKLKVVAQCIPRTGDVAGCPSRAQSHQLAATSTTQSANCTCVGVLLLHAAR